MFAPAAAISILVLASLLVGLARDLVVAYYFGTDWRADLYFIALIIPLFVENSLAISLRDALVPALLQRKEQGEDAYRALSGRIAGFLLLLGAVVWLLFAALPDLWVGAIGDSHLAVNHRPVLLQAYQLGIAMIPLMLWLYFLSALCHAERAFVLPAWRGVLLNVGGLAALWLLRSTPALLAGMLAGLMLHVLLLQLRLGRLPLAWPRPAWRSGGTGVLMLRRFITLLVVALLLQGAIGAERLMANLTGEGGLARLSYAFRIVTVPLVVFTFGMMGIAYARFSTAVARADDDVLGQAFRDTARICLFILLPTAVAFTVFSREILALVLFRGAFTDHDMAQTASVMRIYATGLPAMGLTVVLARMLVVLDRFRPLLAATTVAVALTALGYVMVYRAEGIEGLALVTVGGALLQCLLLWLALPATHRCFLSQRDLLASGLSVVALALVLPCLSPRGLAGLVLGGALALALPVALQWLLLRRDFVNSLGRSMGRQG